MLNSLPMAESDLLLILFTENLGKLKALAKGALKSQKRFLGILLNLNLLEVELVAGKGEFRYLVNLAQLKRSRWKLAQNPLRLASAYVLAELVEKGTEDLEADLILYELLESGLERIQSERNFREQMFYYLLRMLEKLGYLPSLDFCAVCGKKFQPETAPNHFSIRKGGYVCEDCGRKPNKDLREISVGFFRTLKAIRRLSASRPARIRILEKDYQFGLQLFNDFISWQMGKPINSLEFLRKFEESKPGKK